jgi:acetyltransferase-like isoleucine patch superfamily enzyme
MDRKELSYIIQTLVPSFLVNLYLSLRFGCFVHPGAKIYWPGNLKLGRKVKIGKGTTIIAQGKKDAVVIGDNVIINDYCVINNKGGKISIGKGTSINHFSMIQATGDVVIGEGVRIAPYVRFVPNHKIENGKVYETSKSSISVGDGTWFGAGVTVILGNNIGRNCIIGANAVVNRSVADGQIAVGVPIKILEKR